MSAIANQSAVLDVAEGLSPVEAMERLSPAEILALECLGSGGTIEAAARAAKVTRKTIYAWLAAGKPLKVALDVWRDDLLRSAQYRFLGLMSASMETIGSKLRQGDFRAALGVLQRAGTTKVSEFALAMEDARLSKERAQARMMSTRAEQAEVELKISRLKLDGDQAALKKIDEAKKPVAPALDLAASAPEPVPAVREAVIAEKMPGDVKRMEMARPPIGFGKVGGTPINHRKGAKALTAAITPVNAALAGGAQAATGASASQNALLGSV